MLCEANIGGRDGGKQKLSGPPCKGSDAGSTGGKRDNPASGGLGPSQLPRKKGAAAADDASTLQDTSVRQIDGRSDRLLKNLKNDVARVEQMLEDDVLVGINIVDTEHIIGTGAGFKAAILKVREKIKKIRVETCKIGYKIDRAVDAAAFQDVRGQLDGLKTKLDVVSNLCALPGDTTADVEAAIALAEEENIDVSISFHCMSFFHKWQNLISMERLREALNLMEKNSESVLTIGQKLKTVPASVPAEVRSHLRPEFLAACALERSFESFMVSKAHKNFAKSHLAKTLHGLMVSVAEAPATNLLQSQSGSSRYISRLLMPEKVGYTELGDALCRVIPTIREDPQAAPVLDDEPDPLIKLLGCSCGRQVIENAQSVYIARADEAAFDKSSQAVTQSAQQIIEAVGKAPSCIDEVVPKLKQLQQDMIALADGKIKSKSAKAQVKEVEGKVEEAFAVAVRSPCTMLTPIFQALPPCSEDLKKVEKMTQFWESVEHHMQDADNFEAERFIAFLDEMAQPESELLWRERKKLFADASRCLRRAVSFFKWMCLYKFSSGDKLKILGATEDDFSEWEKLAAEGASVFVKDLGCDKASWETFEGSALALFRDWQKNRFAIESQHAFAALDCCVIALDGRFEEDGSGDEAFASFQASLAGLKKMAPDTKAAFTSFESFFETCSAMSKQALRLSSLSVLLNCVLR